MKDFYNTINAEGVLLELARAATEKQDVRIEAIFKHKGASTPAEIHSLYVKLFGDCPLTSIRRSITNLTERGVLEKTEIMRQGSYGKPNYVWKMK